MIKQASTSMHYLNLSECRSCDHGGDDALEAEDYLLLLGTLRIKAFQLVGCTSFAIEFNLPWQILSLLASCLFAASPKLL